MTLSQRAGAAACAAALVLAAAPSSAAAADPWLSGVARQLGGDPVHVSASVSRAVSAAEHSRLRAAVRAMPVPTRVAILSGSPGNGYEEGLHSFELPDLLAGAVDRPGLYVVAEASDYGALHLAAVGVRTHVAPDDVERAVRDDVLPEARVVARLRYALRVAAAGARPARGAAERALDARHRDRDSDTENEVAIGFAGGGGLLAFAVPTALWWRRRPRGGRAGGTTGRRPAVREPAANVPRQASDAVARLAAALAAAPEPPDPAFELYSAASKAEREARTAVDHVGALLLARDGLALVSGRAQRRRCFFDPGHRGPTTDTRWRLGSEESEVPACPHCVRALAAGRMPDTLGDRGRPYFERDTVWARTGFGTIDRELAAKVLSGR